MRIQAVERDRSAVWHYSEKEFLGLGVWTEKKEGLGEDAHPLLLHNWSTHRGVTAVFDGLGGAGAAKAGRSSLGVERSQAWVGANGTRALVEEWFLDASDRQSECDADALRALLVDRLAELKGPSRSKIFGTMRREMPTTMAGLSYRVAGPLVHWQALWAGDSRCYLLDPLAGLQQLTRDDTSSDDALTLLVDDPPMTNVICLDRDFVLNVNRGAEEMPCLFVTATDGFFGQLNTPAEFEHVLLETLLAADDGAEWGERLTELVGTYTGDDASLTVVGFGFEDFRELRRSFRQRARKVVVEHVEPVRGLLDDRSGFVLARAESWQEYRKDYEHRMPALRPEGGL